MPFTKGRKAWNKGLTKNSNEAMRRNAEGVSKTLKQKHKEGLLKTNKGRKINQPLEYLKKLSIKQSLNNSGGRCKWFEVAGQKVQGTWERDICLKFESLGIKWYKPKVNTDVFFYSIDNKLKSYTPDIYLEELDLFLEIKGYWWGNDKKKMESVLELNPGLKKKLVLIQKKEFLEIIEAKEKGIVAELVRKQLALA